MPSMTGDWDNSPPTQRDGSRWPEDKVHQAMKPVETEQQRRTRLYKETHRVSELSKLPTDIRYWGISQDSMTYDSGYGDNGRPDMCTSQYLTIAWFESDEALEAWVLERVERRESYKIFRAEPVNTQVKAVFSIVK